MTRNSEQTGAWRPIYRDLRKRIDCGEYRPGDHLPTIAALADRMGLSRHGARKVLESLRDDGFVQSWQGRGYRVAEPRIDIRLDSFPRWGKSAARAGRSGLARLISSRIVRANTVLAREMNLSVRDLVYVAELVRSADDQTLALSRSHFSKDRFPGILDDLSETGSVTQALARHGVDICERQRTRVEARMPTGHEALLLGISKGQPVMVSTGINTNGSGEVVEVSKSVFRADCVAFEF